MQWICGCGFVYVVFLLLAYPAHVLLLAYHVLLLRLIRGQADQLYVATLGRGPRVAPIPAYN